MSTLAPKPPRQPLAEHLEVVESAAPLGATVLETGVNFSVYSKHAPLVELLLFDRVGDARPARMIPIDPTKNRDYHYWHLFVPGVRPGQIYGYRASGPLDPSRGLRFDPEKVLLDPYGRGVVVPDDYNRQAASRPGQQRGCGDEERRGRSGGLRLGRRPAAPHAIVAHAHLRDARPGLHETPELGCFR